MFLSRMCHRPMGRRCAGSQRGIAMFETLIAIVILVLGVIGFLELLQFSLRNNDSAGFRTQASHMASEMLDRMRGNRDAALSGNYNVDFGDTPSGSGPVAVDLSQWLGSISGSLPQGQGAISCDNASRSCDVTIRWDDSRGTEGSATQEFLVRSLL